VIEVYAEQIFDFELVSETPPVNPQTPEVKWKKKIIFENNI